MVSLSTESIFWAFYQTINQSTFFFFCFMFFLHSEMTCFNMFGKKHLRYTENKSLRWQREEKKTVISFCYWRQTNLEVLISWQPLTVGSWGDPTAACSTLYTASTHGSFNPSSRFTGFPGSAIQVSSRLSSLCWVDTDWSLTQTMVSWKKGSVCVSWRTNSGSHGCLKAYSWTQSGSTHCEFIKVWSGLPFVRKARKKKYLWVFDDKCFQQQQQ